MMESKAFYKSQERFNNWRTEKYHSSKCVYQNIDLQQGIWIEKWISYDNNQESIVYLVDIYPHANGFDVYTLSS